jgi:hypothetical protein
MKTVIENVKKFALLLALIFGISALASASSKVPVKVSDLQKSITAYIAKDYAGYTIKNAFKLDQNKTITYDVNVVKGNQIVRLEFDNSGTFLKAIQPQDKTKSKTNTISKTAMIQKPHSDKTKK